MKVLPEATSEGGPSRTDASAAGSASSASALWPRLDRLRELGGAGLREEWRRLNRSEPPRLSPDLLRRAIAYRVQELELGGLPKWARQSLAGGVVQTHPAEAEGELEPKPRLPEASPLKPGTRLVREWHGRTHVVTVLDDAFEFEQRHYRSLTQIAREITGAHWSGPRFFGLTKRQAASGSDVAPAFKAASPSAICADEAGGSAPSRRKGSSIGARSQAGVSAFRARRLEPRAMENANG